MAYRPEWFEEVANGRNVLTIALHVHMTVTGSYDRSWLQQEEDVNCLEEVLRSWQPSDYIFGDLVKTLINQALMEHYSGKTCLRVNNGRVLS